MIKRYKKCKNWRRLNTNGRFYKFLVLIGLAHSPPRLKLGINELLERSKK